MEASSTESCSKIIYCLEPEGTSFWWRHCHVRSKTENMGSEDGEAVFQLRVLRRGYIPVAT